MKSLSIALLLSSWMAVCAEEQPIQQKEEKLDSLRGMQQALEENEQNHSSRGSTRAERLKRMADLTVEERRELVRASEESCGSSSQSESVLLMMLCHSFLLYPTIDSETRIVQAWRSLFEQR